MSHPLRLTLVFDYTPPPRVGGDNQPLSLADQIQADLHAIRLYGIHEFVEWALQRAQIDMTTLQILTICPAPAGAEGQPEGATDAQERPPG